mgnify:CR=1 FL=1
MRFKSTNILILLVGAFTFSSLESKANLYEKIDSIIVSVGLYGDQNSPTYQEQLDSLSDLLEIVNDLNYTRGQMLAMGEIGITHFVYGFHDDAHDYLSKALLIAEYINDSSSIGSFCDYLGSLQQVYENYDKAEAYYLKGIPYLDPAVDVEILVSCYSGLGHIYIQRNEIERAIVIFENNYDYAKKFGSEIDVYMPLTFLGNSYAALEKLDIAIQYNEKALLIAESLGEKSLTAYSCLGLGKIYFELNNFGTAEQYFKRSLQLAIDNDINNLEYKNYKYLSMIEAEKENYLPALHYYELYNELKDSIEVTNRAMNFDQLQTKFDVQRMEKEALSNKITIKTLAYQQGQKTTHIKLIITVSLASILIISLILFGLAKNVSKKKTLINKKEELAIIDKKLYKINLEKEQVSKRNLESEIAIKNKELTNFALEIGRKNEFSQEILKRLKIIGANDIINSMELKDLIFFTHTQLEINSSFQDFQGKVDMVNAQFFETLKSQYQECTPNDRHISGLVRLGLSSKEIASIKNISVSSVEISRHRLRKKLKLPKHQNLFDFLNEI